MAALLLTLLLTVASLSTVSGTDILLYDLRPSEDTYIWAAEHFLDTNLADGTYMGYYIDKWWSQAPKASTALSENLGLNQDWVIKNRGFIFDLSPWDDEAPNDDPNQPIGADFNALITILREAWMSSVQVV